jgi:N-acetylglucosamine kinase-like BadF-type ATPase
MILVAESGSTKSDWVLIDPNGREIDRWSTMGFNPYFHSADKVYNVLSTTEGLNVWADKITQTWFYGAGCSSPAMRAIITEGLNRVFTHAENHVDHDLNAAAYALYDGEPEIACILGTGSNSCFFDGTNVREEVPALAYILGDEGSASFIGKQLLADFLYKKMPPELNKDFDRTYNITKDEIFDRVYNQPHANVFLASFGPFAGKHKDHKYIKALVRNGIRKFIDIHVKCYPESATVNVNFVGSVAKAFEDIIQEELAKDNIKFGRVLAKPVNSLIKYHIDFMHVLQTQKA